MNRWIELFLEQSHSFRQTDWLWFYCSHSPYSLYLKIWRLNTFFFGLLHEKISSQRCNFSRIFKANNFFLRNLLLNLVGHSFIVYLTPFGDWWKLFLWRKCHRRLQHYPYKKHLEQILIIGSISLLKILLVRLDFAEVPTSFKHRNIGKFELRRTEQ